MSNTPIQSVQRAASILRCFAKTDAELGVTAISRELGLHKSTVSRLLSTLQEEGFVEQNLETGKYRLGLALVTLAGIVLDRIDLRQIAHPHLSELAELTQETVNMVVLAESECMNIGGADSPRPIQYVGRIGRRTPVHCTAGGKLLLAYQSAEAAETILSQGMSRFTDSTIVDKDILLQTLPKIQALGFAITHEEHQEGLSALATPIYNHAAQVVAAVTVTGPTYRIGPGKLEEFVNPSQTTARNISRQLGYSAA